MAKKKFPATPALRVLRAANVPFVPMNYDYVEKGGTASSSQALKVSEHCIIKTLIMEDETKTPLIALMHGDAEVSTKRLARHMGVKSICPCSPENANRHSGYSVGGTSPFGTRRKMPVYMQQSILELHEIFINAGARGFLVKMCPKDVAKVLSARIAELST